jgi:hypothetical protein
MSSNLDLGFSDNNKNIEISVSEENTNADVDFNSPAQKINVLLEENDKSLPTTFEKLNVIHNGQNGATFTPQVSNDGILSWTNDRGLENPHPINIKGDKGERGEQGIQGIQGLKGDRGEDGYTPIKGIDYFDGTNGKDGVDGYTPIKGVDYFDGKDGRDGKNGKDGIDGVDGKDGVNGIDGVDGKDGISVTHEWDGTILKITSASGTSSADLKGQQGEQGIKGDVGPQGKTAYEYAQQYGFMGTEEEFGRLMSLISDVDQIGNIEDYWQYNEQTKDLVTAINQNADYVNKNFEKNENKSQVIQGDSESETKYPSVKAVYDLGQDIEENINTKVKLFHATLDPITTQYIKDSGDFTYADVLATENCKIEAKFGNVKIIFNKEIFRNTEPDPVAGRYVEFSALLRNGPTTVKVFLFVYDPENLPTDPNSVAVLENWGDSQYCAIEVQHIVIGDFLDNDISVGRYNTINAPSTKAAGDYVDSQCGIVLEYMQTTFAQNIMTLVNQRFGPHIIYDDPTGFEASNDDAGDTWHLTGLNLSQYKRIKCYVCSGGDSDSNYSPEHIVEVYLDDRAKGSFGYFSASHTGHNPNNRNRYHIVTFTVNAEKTAIQFQHSISIYGTSATNSSGGRRCYLIEGYVL